MVNNLDYSAEGREAIAYILYEYQYDIWYDINRDGATLELRRRGQTDKKRSFAVFTTPYAAAYTSARCDCVRTVRVPV